MSASAYWIPLESSSRSSTARTPISNQVKVHPHHGPGWVTTPRKEVKQQRVHRRLCWKLSDLEITGLIFALLGLVVHIISMATLAWGTYHKKNGDLVGAGLFPQCQYLHGCLPVGPVGGVAIVAVLYGISVPVLFTIYATCCWRRWGGRYLEYATTVNCFVTSLGILAALLLAGFRLWGFPPPGFELDYSFYLDIVAGCLFIIAGFVFLIHVCLQSY